MSKQTESQPAQATVTFSKQQFLESSQFAPLEKDVLSALLEDSEMYTNEQVKQIIDNFSKRTV
ncbi:hypothetical protein D3C73_643770 [compost metagenome]